MTSSLSYDVLDLRHFSASALRPLLDAEAAIWSERLHWDYRASSRLLLQYLDNRLLPGYVAVENNQITGYTFCVYEETKAVIGDLFAVPALSATAESIQHTLLKHQLETLLNSPHIDRVESQMLLHPSGNYSELFVQAGFTLFRRLFLVQRLNPSMATIRVEMPSDLELRPWRDDDLSSAARLIAIAYRGHTDSAINDQYRTLHGSQRFLNNIVRYAGCGIFSQAASHVVVDRSRREVVALVLGSRVSAQSGHVTQLCVHPDYRRLGIARGLLNLAASHFVRLGANEISLTVTEANVDALDLYESEGYECRHTFDATVWQRPNTVS
ncbi:MAG: GNAT family N-acetyltransferase [Acidobacteriota bacterium]|nr:GNAT family N-acetyltransferase [Acidobacteriota bacterium]